MSDILVIEPTVKMKNTLAGIEAAWRRSQTGQTPQTPAIDRVVANAQAIAAAWNASKHAGTPPTVDKLLEVMPAHLQPKAQF